MKHEIRSLTFLILALTGAVTTSLGGTACETTDPTEARIVNEFSAPNDGPATVRWTILKVWYRSTLFEAPIAPSETSETLRVATGSEPAYAILRKETLSAAEGGGGTDDAGTGDSTPRPDVLIAARTRAPIEFAVGDQKTIPLSPTTLLIGCGGINGLSQPDYDFIRERIFPGDGLPPFSETGCDGTSTVLDADAAQPNVNADR